MRGLDMFPTVTKGVEINSLKEPLRSTIHVIRPGTIVLQQPAFSHQVPGGIPVHGGIGYRSFWADTE